MRYEVRIREIRTYVVEAEDAERAINLAYSGHGELVARNRHGVEYAILLPSLSNESAWVSGRTGGSGRNRGGDGEPS
jgi:hypothetical protein